MQSRGAYREVTCYSQDQGHGIKLTMEGVGFEGVAQSVECLPIKSPGFNAQHYINQESGICL